MKNPQALKLVDKIISNLNAKGIENDTLIEDIKSLRAFAIEEEQPLVVKVLRLTYEHIEENETFLIPMLEDDAFEEEEDEEVVATELNPVESLQYVILLTKNLTNKSNISDLKEYKQMLLDY